MSGSEQECPIHTELLVIFDNGRLTPETFKDPEFIPEFKARGSE